MKRLTLFAVLVFGVLVLGQVTISFWHAMSRAHGEVLNELIQKF
jgi:ABC-type glycerol-3-phosphate transport system substrate-binding protein